MSQEVISKGEQTFPPHRRKGRYIGREKNKLRSLEYENLVKVN